MRQLTKEGCNKNIMGAAIAQWICLCLPSCCPGFESQTYHLRYYQFILELYKTRDSVPRHHNKKDRCGYKKKNK